jgi:hypothetical protein
MKSPRARPSHGARSPSNASQLEVPGVEPRLSREAVRTETRENLLRSKPRDPMEGVDTLDATPRELHVSPGRILRTTPAFDTYWRFAVKRQELFMRRVAGAPPPWTDDSVIGAHRFTNAYRASDRVSQYLIRNVIYQGDQTGEEVFFRTLLFKFFNRIDTWTELVARVGFPCRTTFSFDRYANALDAVLARGDKIYSAAYIMPSPSFGSPRKHRNHLRLLEYMLQDGAPKRIGQARSLKEVFALLRGYRSLGDFLAFQFAIDLNYSSLVDFSEMDFVVAGPGARNGIRKCFSDAGGLSEEDVIRVMSERASAEFERLGLVFQTLWGRPLQLIDCQNLFCEVDKYSRVVHPELKGESGRTRIKQRFTMNPRPLPQWYPPKWRLDVPLHPPDVKRQTHRALQESIRVDAVVG